MKIKVDSRELARAITSSIEVATKNCKKDFDYEGLLTLEAKKDRVMVFSYGGSASLIADISNENFGSLGYECDKEGMATVKALDLNDSLTTMESGEVSISAAGKEMTVTLLHDKAYKRSMGLHSNDVSVPNEGKEPDISIEIKRDVFIKGLRDILFAPADEEKMMNYMCMVFDVKESGGEESVCFSAGSGGRFAIKEMTGKDITAGEKNIRIIFPKNNLSSLLKMVSSCGGEDKIKIETFKQDAKNNIPEQIDVSSNNIKLCIFGTENFSKYPDLNTVLSHKYTNCINTDLKGWSYAVGGVNMTRRDYSSNIHNTEVLLDGSKERLLVTPQTPHACTTPVAIPDMKNSLVQEGKVWFKCNSEYLSEIVKRGEKEGTINIKFDSQEALEGVPQGQHKQLKPVLVTFPDKTDSIVGVSEKFYIFFAVSSK